MKIISETDIPDLKIIEPRKCSLMDRGYFFETCVTQGASTRPA